ncbi:head-to-tail adaptor [Gordonia phage ChisanaKitsune]|uniref:Head-to-tail adaptor n=1 Tax=Gordonia phage ChisanaKitsune TaxID=2871538 RepID=A0AAE7XF16_9CAUD|nr:head-to-tail adaptor [Gordonia phage ChisanaKitsune]QZE10806.1 head-to-tail adaptor [Gordonia phage ChisanaKitsune]
MGLVTVPEFRAYMSGNNLNALQLQAAEAALNGVQSELERYLNRSVQMRRVTEEVELDEFGRGYLKNTPIEAVYGLFRHSSTGGVGEAIVNVSPHLFRKGANFINVGWGFTNIWVDYLGGLNGDKIPGLKLAIMRVAAREFVHQQSDNLAISNTEARPPSDPVPQPKGWTEQELQSFDRYRRRTVV